MEHYTLATPSSLQRLSYALLRRSIARDSAVPRRGAVVFSLEGELGSGKTTLVQGLGRFLGLRRPIRSPTFLIMRELALPQPVSGVDKLYHFDWYRVNQEQDVLALGWKNIIQDEKAVVAVEWGDRFPALLPRGTTVVSLRHPSSASPARSRTRNTSAASNRAGWRSGPGGRIAEVRLKL